VSLRSLLVLGVSGGILPCPSALVVLLSAIAFHRVAFGLLLIVAFSLGLATVLTGIGIVMVHGHRLIGQASGRRTGLMPAISRTVRLLPVFSAAVVALLGSGIALSALNPGMLPAVVL
jgi:nickel/cobalt exporter